MKNGKLILCISAIVTSSVLAVYAACDDKIKHMESQGAGGNSACAYNAQANPPWPDSSTTCTYQTFDTAWDKCDGQTGKDPKSGKVCTSEAAPGSSHATHNANGTCNGSGDCSSGTSTGVGDPVVGQTGSLADC
jgi:hypothetical protein